MKPSGVLFIVYCSVMLNSLLLFIFGEKGSLAYESLKDYRNRLEANITSVIDKNGMLKDKLDFVVKDKEHVSVLAREIGYYKKDEMVMVLDGYKPPGSFYEIGDYVSASKDPRERNNVLRIISICGTVCAIVLYGILSNRKKHADKRNRS